MLGQEDAFAGSRLRRQQRHRADTDASHYHAVERVIGAMREHLDDSFSLNDMADVAIMSPFHFNRTFREVTGVPPCHFLGAIRLEAAKRLLVTTQLSVTDVCFEVGYNSLGTFTRRFTELLGLSPRRLRMMANSPLGRVHLPAGDPRPWARTGAVVSGRVDVPSPVRQPIFIGLFRTPIPAGRPVACTLLEAAGPYRIAGVPQDCFYLFGAAITWSGPREYLLYESAVRGGGQPVCVNGASVSGSTDLILREAALTDPPILVTFPLLLTQRDRAARSGRSSAPVAALTSDGLSPS